MKLFNILALGAIIGWCNPIFAQSSTESPRTITLKTINAQANEVTFMVNGACGMCKKRIETAAYGKGVKLADWDKNSQMIKVVFNPKRTNTEAIVSRIAAVGHDAHDQKADTTVYQSLPKCCAYGEVAPH